MNALKRNTAIASLLISAITLPLSLHADTKLNPANPHFGEKGWDVDFTVGASTFSDTLYKTDEDINGHFYFGVNLSYYGEDFYFIADDEEGLLAAYSIAKQDDTVFDVVLAPRFGGFHENDLLTDLNERDVDLHLGLRYTQYFDDTILTVEASQDISGAHSGSILSTSFEKEWQIKNWIVTGIVSAAYLSEEMTDYYFGVSNSEAANSSFLAHSVGASVFATAGVKAEYPINENWVFNAAISHTVSDGEISKSPITLDADQLTMGHIGVKYHF